MPQRLALEVTQCDELAAIARPLERSFGQELSIGRLNHGKRGRHDVLRDANFDLRQVLATRLRRILPHNSAMPPLPAEVPISWSDELDVDVVPPDHLHRRTTHPTSAHALHATPQ